MSHSLTGTTSTNLAKSDKILADSSWFNRICNTVLQGELAQQDGTKTTGLATKPVRPEQKTHLITIKQVTNEFNATTNENDNPHSDTEAKSIESKDSTEEEIDTRNWMEQEMASFITSWVRFPYTLGRKWVESSTSC